MVTNSTKTVYKMVYFWGKKGVTTKDDDRLVPKQENVTPSFADNSQRYTENNKGLDRFSLRISVFLFGSGLIAQRPMPGQGSRIE